MTESQLIEQVTRWAQHSYPHVELSPDAVRDLARVGTQTVSRVGATHGQRMTRHRMRAAAYRSARVDDKCGSLLSTIGVWLLWQIVDYLLHLWLRDGVETRCMHGMAAGLPAWSADEDGEVTQLECSAMVADKGSETDLIGGA